MTVSENVPVAVADSGPAVHRGAASLRWCWWSGALSSVSLSSSSVSDGRSVTGTVRLTAAAPTGGAVESVASSDTTVAAVSSTVTVQAATTGTTFTVATRSVSSDRTVTISASYAGVTKTTTLTVKRW